MHPTPGAAASATLLAVAAVASATLLAVAAVASTACSAKATYDGAGRDHAWVGRDVQGPAACDVAGVLNADACVSGTPVRIVWEDGEPQVSDAACLGDRMNVAVRDGQVVGAWEDREG